MSRISSVVHEGQFCYLESRGRLRNNLFAVRPLDNREVLLRLLSRARRYDFIVYLIQIHKRAFDLCISILSAFDRRYLGNLTVWFNEQGEVVDWDGNPILLDHSIEEGELSVPTYPSIRLASSRQLMYTPDTRILELIAPRRGNSESTSAVEGRSERSGAEESRQHQGGARQPVSQQGMQSGKFHNRRDGGRGTYVCLAILL